MNRLKLFRAVQEMWDRFGPEASKAAAERAAAVEARGRITLAHYYREIAEICEGLEALPPRKS